MLGARWGHAGGRLGAPWGPSPLLGHRPWDREALQWDAHAAVGGQSGSQTQCWPAQGPAAAAPLPTPPHTPPRWLSVPGPHMPASTPCPQQCHSPLPAPHPLTCRRMATSLSVRLASSGLSNTPPIFLMATFSPVRVSLALHTSP